MTEAERDQQLVRALMEQADRIEWSLAPRSDHEDAALMRRAAAAIDRLSALAANLAALSRVGDTPAKPTATTGGTPA